MLIFALETQKHRNIVFRLFFITLIFNACWIYFSLQPVLNFIGWKCFTSFVKQLSFLDVLAYIQKDVTNSFLSIFMYFDIYFKRPIFKSLTTISKENVPILTYSVEINHFRWVIKWLSVFLNRARFNSFLKPDDDDDNDNDDCDCYGPWNFMSAGSTARGVAQVPFVMKVNPLSSH